MSSYSPEPPKEVSETNQAGSVGIELNPEAIQGTIVGKQQEQGNIKQPQSQGRG